MDTGRILLDLVVILLVSRAAAEIAERFGQPAVLAEIGIGILIGPTVLSFVADGEILEVLGEIGAILLLFEVGREMDIKELRRVGGSSMRVALIGVAVPFALGVVAMRAMGIAQMPAIFIGAGITATSVGITARVLGDLRALATPEARTILGAAVADDVLGLIILAVVTQMATSGAIEPATVLAISGAAVGFVVLATLIGTRVLPRALDRIAGRARTEGTLMAVGLAVALGFAWLASEARLAPIVGAFVAGLAVGRSDAAEDLHRRLTPLGHFFIPIFFLGIGIRTDVGVFADTSLLAAVGVLCAVAVVGKIVAGVGVARGAGSRLLVGVGMIPRGEVGLIFAGIGLSTGVLDARAYGILIAVVMITTVVTPPWIRALLMRTRLAPGAGSETEPPEGWLSVTGDDVELMAEPPAVLAPHIALAGAMACRDRRPGDRLVGWLQRSNQQAAWDDELRGALFALLRDGNGRSWRFLEMSAMLPALFPDLTAALRARPRDPFDLDTGGSIHFDLLDDLKRVVRADQRATRAWSALPHPEVVLLSAFLRSVLVHSRDAGETARRVAITTGLIEHTDFVAFLIGDRNLLATAAARPDSLGEETVLELASAISSIDRAAGLYVLAMAEDAMERWERERMDTLYQLVTAALTHPDLTGPAARELVERQRQEVIEALPRLPQDRVRKLLREASRRYLLAHSAETVARHVRMLRTTPVRDEVRLEAEPGTALDTWRIHIVLLDRDGALASIAAALADHGISVDEAWITTWRNGIIVDVFSVKAPHDTDWERVREGIEQRLRSGGPVLDRFDAELVLDNSSSWHTIVELRAADRVGLLARAAALMASAQIAIHQATVSTRDGVAVDTFLVTDREGHKLDSRAERTLIEAFAGSGRPQTDRLPPVTVDR